MTVARLKSIPKEFFIPDEDGYILADSFEVGMILDVSKKGKKARCYSPQDVDFPLNCLEWISGDKF